MIRQRRYTTGVDSLEVPGGGVDDDEPHVAAARELREETGYAAATWRDLGPVYSLNGVADAPGRVFLATGLSRVGGDEREVEGISDVLAMPFRDLFARIRRQEITDNESLAALLLALVALDRVRSS
ncbi:NUDIX domain-containing protein [Microlunatus parietis]|nr:NUDIX hydrolase [Microlunatus parietis]